MSQSVKRAADIHRSTMFRELQTLVQVGFARRLPDGAYAPSFRLAVLGNAVNLLLFTNGRILREVPPIIPAGHDVPQTLTANPLPQALILTAIVISFSFFCFLLVLTYRAYQDLGTDDTDEMRVAEPKGAPLPPMGY